MPDGLGQPRAGEGCVLAPQTVAMQMRPLIPSRLDGAYAFSETIPPCVPPPLVPVQHVATAASIFLLVRRRVADTGNGTGPAAGQLEDWLKIGSRLAQDWLKMAAARWAKRQVQATCVRSPPWIRYLPAWPAPAAARVTSPSCGTAQWRWTVRRVPGPAGLAWQTGYRAPGGSGPGVDASRVPGRERGPADSRRRLLHLSGAPAARGSPRGATERRPRCPGP